MLNSYIAYIFGLVAYLAHMSLKNACQNCYITDFQRQFNDILVLKQKEARFAGYQFMLIYITCTNMIFAYRYEAYRSAETKSFGHFVEIDLCSIVFLLCLVI